MTRRPPAASDFLPCIVSDAGGFDDKSFNQLSYEGVQQAADELGVEFKGVESNSENDYAPNLESLVAEGCDAIVTVGFALAAATKESAAANPDIKYILIDDAADGGDDGATFDGKADEPNIKPLLYDTAQAAFLAGYAAADYTKTGVVGTYGGLPFPTVTIFMDGFKQGAEYYAKEKGKDVKVVGWDGKDGSFTGGFEANETATNTARQLLDQDVDVILPVGGPIYQGALTAIDGLRRGRRDDRCGRRRLRDRPEHPGRDPHLDPEEHEGLDLRGHHVRGQRRGVRLHAVHRHVGERRRRPRAVPQLREQGVRQPRLGAGRGEGRHHRRLDPGDVVPVRVRDQQLDPVGGGRFGPASPFSVPLFPRRAGQSLPGRH